MLLLHLLSRKAPSCSATCHPPLKYYFLLQLAKRFILILTLDIIVFKPSFPPSLTSPTLSLYISLSQLAARPRRRPTSSFFGQLNCLES